MRETVVIIGGGPAGLSCCLWLRNLGFAPIVVEKYSRVGGAQRLSAFENTWYLGLSGKTGHEVAERFIEHTEAEGLPVLLGARLQSIGMIGNTFSIRAGRALITASAIVVATGQRFKGSEAIASIPGSQSLMASEHVLFDPGQTPLLPSQVHGQIVAVVGGGDNGLTTARIVGETASHVQLIVRSQLRAFRINRDVMQELQRAGRLTLHQPAEIVCLERRGEQIRTAIRSGGSQTQELLVDLICFRIGYAPNVEEVRQLLDVGGVGSLALTASGHIKTDQYLRTSIPHIYAAGDVTNARDPCVATAVAQGAIAARSVEEDLHA